MPRSIFTIILPILLLAGCSAPRYNADDEPDPTEEMRVTAPKPSGEPVRPTASEPNARPPTTRVDAPWIIASEWTRTNNLQAPRRISGGEKPQFEIESELGTFIFQVGTKFARHNGMLVLLGYEPGVFAGEPCLHRLDFQHNVRPLLLEQPAWLTNQQVIVLDPGHGGRHTGTRSADGKLEKDYTLDWALRLVPLLEADGWTVHLTRTNDVEMNLSNRVAFATSAGADLFLSLHFNASGGGTHQSGLETYCMTPTGMPSNLTRGYEDDSSAVFPNNAFDAENIQLASRLHAALLAANGANDRGIKRARFMTVLKGQECPAVLIEGGFLSNPEEAAEIDDPDYRQKLALAVVDGLRRDKEKP